MGDGHRRTIAYLTTGEGGREGGGRRRIIIV